MLSLMPATTFLGIKMNPLIWHIDSAASNHMTSEIQNFSSFKSPPSNHFNVIANGEKLPSSSMSNIHIALSHSKIQTFSNMLYVPHI